MLTQIVDYLVCELKVLLEEKAHHGLEAHEDQHLKRGQIAATTRNIMTGFSVEVHGGRVEVDV